jgi:hypothetical protein
MNSDGYQSVYLIATSPDPAFNNKAISSMNDALNVVFMGNRGLEYASAVFGWNDETSTLAVRDHIRDGINISPQLLYYQWIPLKFSTVFTGEAHKVPATGLGNTFLVRSTNYVEGNTRPDDPWDPWINATLIVATDGTDRIGMAGDGGEFVSKWYACDNRYGTGSKISWSFDESQESSFCTPLEIYKVNWPKPGLSSSTEQVGTPVPVPPGGNFGRGGVQPTQANHFAQPSFVEDTPQVAAQTMNAAPTAIERSGIIALAGVVAAAFA